MSYFKTIKPYKGLYEASILGDIISLERISPQKHLLPRRVLKPSISPSGYKIVALCKNGIVKYFTVHRLIIESFYGESLLEVNYINGNKLDNCLNNLEYITRAENYLHAQKLGLVKGWIGFKNPKAKLTKSSISEIRKLYKSGDYTQKQLAAKFGIDQTSVSDIVLMKSWR